MVTFMVKGLPQHNVMLEPGPVSSGIVSSSRTQVAYVAYQAASKRGSTSESTDGVEYRQS